MGVPPAPMRARTLDDFANIITLVSSTVDSMSFTSLIISNCG
jgi:hypothetical protein